MSAQEQDAAPAALTAPVDLTADDTPSLTNLDPDPQHKPSDACPDVVVLRHVAAPNDKSKAHYESIGRKLPPSLTPSQRATAGGLVHQHPATPIPQQLGASRAPPLGSNPSFQESVPDVSRQQAQLSNQLSGGPLLQASAGGRPMQQLAPTMLGMTRGSGQHEPTTGLYAGQLGQSGRAPMSPALYMDVHNPVVTTGTLLGHRSKPLSQSGPSTHLPQPSQPAPPLASVYPSTHPTQLQAPQHSGGMLPSLQSYRENGHAAPSGPAVRHPWTLPEMSGAQHAHALNASASQLAAAPGAPYGARTLPLSLQRQGVPAGHHPHLPLGVNGAAGGAAGASKDGKVAMQAVVDALSVAASIEPAEPPTGSMRVALLQHQKLALGWMLSREGARSTKKALCPNGGMLADDQGLGKTVTTIALLVSNLVEPEREWGRVEADLAAPKRKRLKFESYTEGASMSDAKQSGGGAGMSNNDREVPPSESDPAAPATGAGADRQVSAADKQKDIRRRASKSSGGLPQAGTLVVAPTSLLRQWQGEIQNKVHASQNFNTVLYHGKGRDCVSSASSLAAYSVVITSYTMVANECGTIGMMQGGSELIDLASDDEDGTKGGKTGKARKYGDNGLLFSVSWQRVVLDEGQVIKNPRTRVAQAAWALHARHRWILSGTPIQNSVNDLYSYFRFLKWAPFDKQAVFKSQVADVIKNQPEKGFTKLQHILKARAVQGVLLRRMKTMTVDGKPIIDLPSCTHKRLSAEFSVDEQAFYDELKEQSKSVVKNLKDNSGGDAYFNALAHLMRLRQACCHMALVKSKSTLRKPSAEELQAARGLPTEARLALLNVLVRNDGPLRCVHCDDVADDPVASHCSHVLCRSCVLTLLSSGDQETGSCPACGAIVRSCDVHTAAALVATSKVPLPPEVQVAVREVSDQTSAGLKFKRSSKIQRLMEVISEAVEKSPGAASTGAEAGHAAQAAKPKPPMAGRKSKSSLFLASLTKKHQVSKSPSQGGKAAANGSVACSPKRKMSANRLSGGKVVVFSQWTSMLDLVEIALQEDGYDFRRLDGTMSLAHRDGQLEDFKQNPNVVVLLLSLRAASLGLNLVIANHVVLLDLWWNPSVEDQAVDRAHRIGQTRQVHVTRITVPNTVEDKIMQLQERKREVINATFGDGAGAGKARLTGQDLLFLFS